METKIGPQEMVASRKQDCCCRGLPGAESMPESSAQCGMAAIYRIMAASEVAGEVIKKSLPIGKPGKRYQSASRWSLSLTKTREIRQTLRENPERFAERKKLKQKKAEIIRESRKIDVAPFPRHKETIQVKDYKAEVKKLFVNTKSVDILPEDVFEVTPETLPRLNTRIKEMRQVGEPWATIVSILTKDYTSHLNDPIEKTIKKGLVKLEVKKVWEAENSHEQKDANTEQKEMNFDMEELEKSEYLQGEWSLNNSESKTPESAKYLKQHLVHSKIEKL